MYGRAKKLSDVEIGEQNFTPLFVYGTLMAGQKNHEVMETLMARGHAKYSGIATAASWYLAIIEGLPAAYQFDMGPPSLDVVLRGEMYMVTSDGLHILDHFEGHPSLYHRTVVEFRNDANLRYNGYIYHGPKMPRAGRVGIIGFHYDERGDRLISDFKRVDEPARWTDDLLAARPGTFNDRLGDVISMVEDTGCSMREAADECL